MTGPVDKLCEALGYEFQQPELLESALTHRSHGRDNNERLEFLGDAVLGFVVAAELYARYPNMDEGTLSRLRASLVKRETLAVIARELELGGHLRLGSGEMKSGGHRRESILADALEAVIGAVYLDSGIDTARELVRRLFGERLVSAAGERELKDAKTRLQEYQQARGLELPVYEVVSVSGEAHDQTFVVACRIDDIGVVTEGRSSSRRKAEQAAAAEALGRLEHD